MPRTSTLPSGLRPPPARLKPRQSTTADLRAFQRLMTHALVRPLTGDSGLESQWGDGRPMAEVAATFIKPNDRLTSFERLEIYARSYWFRLLDCVYEDCPGLRAAVGDQRFAALIEAYLAKYPSRSFSLRNLCSRLPQFILEQPRLTAPHTAFAHAVAEFEWAQTVAFDEGSRPLLTPADLAARPPDRLTLGLQPYVTLLSPAWPVDTYVIAVKKRDSLRSEASHAVDHAPRPGKDRKVRRPRRTGTYLAVHRVDNALYYKRLTAPAFKILTALAAGQPLTEALAAGGPRVTANQAREWFATWMKLGWLCRRS